MLHAALVARLDDNQDGKLQTGELKNIDERLQPLDRNADELIGPGELADEVAAYPGVAASILLPRVAAGAQPPAGLSLGEASATSPNAIRLELFAESQSADAARAWIVRAADGVRWHVRSDAGRLPAQAETALQNSRAWVERLDRNRDRVIDESEASGDDRQVFDAWRNAADRDGDGRLSAAETDAWLVVQRSLAEAQRLLTVLDLGHGLFEYLDANHDGGLSRRELTDAASRLTADKCLADGALVVERLPRQILCIVASGHPLSPLLSREAAGPAWFQAMDRNGDGSISASEFLGPSDLFTRLDTDADGLLSAAESAARAEPGR
ncbi:MAG: EF-hand domain-containing protein [Pirellulales bacterium]